MIMINDNDYSNAYNKSNDNKKKIKWITKILLLTCEVIKAIIIIIIEKLIIKIMIIIVVIIIVIYKIVWIWCKVGNGEMQYGMCK